MSQAATERGTSANSSRKNICGSVSDLAGLHKNSAGTLSNAALYAVMTDPDTNQGIVRHAFDGSFPKCNACCLLIREAMTNPDNFRLAFDELFNLREAASRILGEIPSL